ncbi:unnamed protein product, partial [Urochloa humidicola]
FFAKNPPTARSNSRAAVSLVYGSRAWSKATRRRRSSLYDALQETTTALDQVRAGIPSVAKARKEAAAAAQDLLKLDAARARKKPAAQSRKGAAASMRKEQGGVRVPTVLERSSGYGAGTPPPRPFTDGSCFFTGSAGGVFGNAGQSHGQPWNPQSSDPATWFGSLIKLAAHIYQVCWSSSALTCCFFCEMP